MNIQKLVDAVKAVQSELDLNIFVYEDVVWMYDDDDLFINTSNNVDDLYNGNARTYCFEARDKVESEDGYVIFYDADNGCGTRDTIILLASERVE